MAGQMSLMQRWDSYQASKTVVFWSCAACVVATMVVGFNWGGWELGGKARAATEAAVATARAELVSVICVERFARAPDAAAKLASLKEVDSWKRDTFIQDGGWATLAGLDTPVAGAAELCARQLMEKNAAPPSVRQPG